jgi:thiamine-phosphate pyrophosphorylase
LEVVFPLTDLAALERAVRKLGVLRRGARTLPALLAFTDPVRSGDLEALARRLPRGSGLVYRPFGAPDALTVAWRLRRITWRRGVLLIIGADAALARAAHADGLHLPERMAGRIVTRRGRGSLWLRTAAAHSSGAARRALERGADAVVLSSILPSDSPSAGRAIGLWRTARLVRSLQGPVYGLGGVSASNAGRLAATGVAGLAGVGVFART